MGCDKNVLREKMIQIGDDVERRPTFVSSSI